LRNLIDNAIKHHDHESGCVKVLAERIGDDLMIVVSDDGPGIPERYQEAVLRPFLQVGSDPAKGSGMGLSMVNKIVGDVGGRIDVGNRVDGARGARIAVSWPLTIKAK
jgi:signal transduction histidine kinase